MFDIVEFLPERAGREAWDRFHAFRRTQHREWEPEEPLAPDDVVEARMKLPDPLGFRRWHHLLAGDEVIGELAVHGLTPRSPEFEGSGHIVDGRIYVLDAHRRRGAGLALAAATVSVMDEHDVTMVMPVAMDEPGHAFLRRLGGEARLTARESRLDLRTLDWDMVARWVREGEERSPDARLDLYPDGMPEELLEAHCAGLNELMRDIPLEGLERGEMVSSPDSLREWAVRRAATRSELPTAVVRDADGSMLGTSDVLKHPHEPGVARQMFTGVSRLARGRGVGKWLKAAMAQHIRAAYPDTDWITTENAGSNEAMLAINIAMGFRLYRTVTVYQVDREALRAAAPTARA
jgi:GNAT superfamily N-acetyltransferase